MGGKFGVSPLCSPSLPSPSHLPARWMACPHNSAVGAPSSEHRGPRTYDSALRNAPLHAWHYT